MMYLGVLRVCKLMGIKPPQEHLHLIWPQAQGGHLDAAGSKLAVELVLQKLAN